jgi:hypothetical protein
MADLEDELVASLRARLAADAVDDARFVGPPVDIRGLSPLGLGRLLAPLRRAAWWQRDVHSAAAVLARRIRNEAAIAGILPALDAESGLEVFQGIATGDWPAAIEHLGYLVAKPSPALQVELRRILGDPTRWSDDASQWDAFKALALLRWGEGTEQELEQLHASVRERWANSPLRLAEFEVLQHVGLAALLAMARTMGGYYVKGDADEGKDPAVELADDAAYVAFAKETLEAAVRRLDDIHSGQVKYESDKAFEYRDAGVIARCVRVAAYRDDAWLRPLILALLPRVSVAPTAAKTVPSQSVAMALGHAVAAIPTPEGVLALRQALAVVRHAGVKKKLGKLRIRPSGQS